MKETPSQLEIPSYLMSFPHTISSNNSNNIWMTELSEKEKIINKKIAYSQFLDVYGTLSCSALVYLLPAEGNFQDLVYVANIGTYIPHIKDKNIIVLSNFKSEPRIGEELIGKKFFESMGYECYKNNRDYFEGEAELKYLYDNIYIGGYGIRSELNFYNWFEKEFDSKVIKLEETDEYLYHLDCTVFPISNDSTLICTEMYVQEEIQEIEEYTEIIDVSADDAYNGICNSVRLHNFVLCASDLNMLSKKDSRYNEEKHKTETLTKICSNIGMEPIFINLSEYMKSGALLSCMVMHLNYNSRQDLV